MYTLDIPERDQFLELVFQETDFALPVNPSGALRRLWEAALVFQEEFPEELRGDALPYFVDWLPDGVCMVGIRAATPEQGWEINFSRPKSSTTANPGRLRRDVPVPLGSRGVRPPDQVVPRLELLARPD